MTYPVYIGDRAAGTMTVTAAGQDTVFELRCPDPEPGLWRALYAAQARADQPLDPVDDGGQQICHHQAHQHRRQNGCQLRHHPLQRAVHIKRVIEHQNGADGEKNRQAPFQIAALSFHKGLSFYTAMKA